jgi:hypothetical protein
VKAKSLFLFSTKAKASFALCWIAFANARRSFLTGVHPEVKAFGLLFLCSKYSNTFDISLKRKKPSCDGFLLLGGPYWINFVDP